MTRIKETRNFLFGNKILKLDDVHQIAQILNAEYMNAQLKKERCSVNFEVSCEGGIAYESSDITIFDSHSIINSKKPLKILLWFSNYDSDSRIRVNFKQECNSKYSENSVLVEGYDSNWVNGVLGRIQDTIESIGPQAKNKGLYLNLIYLASALLIGRIFTFIIQLLPFGSLDESKMSATLLTIRHFIHANAFIYDYFMGFFVGASPAIFIRNYFEKLWPYLEIQIGPDHALGAKIRRAKLKNLVRLIIIPLALALLYDILKNLF